ncbi:unnamed protein product [Blepharisma stoltei]|uniref:Uncharacterized protein n=1 Tax=Blepharisma stoltei TaxID=1481888 RepID=A0AAU9JHG6_9CILI|nr:unnamed protein product [Blepharisma stoltei]
MMRNFAMKFLIYYYDIQFSRESLDIFFSNGEMCICCYFCWRHGEIMGATWKWRNMDGFSGEEQLKLMKTLNQSRITE